jgi:starch phosphorylase
VEILEEVGPENIFIFGKTAAEVEQLRPSYNPHEVVAGDEEIREALELIQQEFFSLLDAGIFRPALHSLLEGGDRYFVLSDLRSYIETQDRVDLAFRDRETWDRKAIINVARSGHFSSDRTIREYASDIWNIAPCEIPPYVPGK